MWSSWLYPWHVFSNARPTECVSLKKCLTIESSSAWKESTTTRPPGQGSWWAVFKAHWSPFNSSFTSTPVYAGLGKVLAAGRSWQKNLSVLTLWTAAVTMVVNCLVETTGILSRARTIVRDMWTKKKKRLALNWTLISINWICSGSRCGFGLTHSPLNRK